MTGVPVHELITAEELYAVFRRVVPFRGDDEGDPIGLILLEATQGHRRWVATDSYRLAVLEGGETGSDFSLLISPRLVSAGLALAQDGSEEPLLLTAEGDPVGSRTSASLSTRGARVDLPAAQGGFPDWRKAVATPGERPAVSVRAPRALLEAVVAEARQAPAGVDTSRIEPLFWLGAGDGNLAIRVDWGPRGISSFELSAETDGRTQVPVNPAYLADLLDACLGEQAHLLLPDDPDQPLLLLDDSWTGFLAPMDPSAERLRPRLESALCEAFSLPDVERDEDGNYPIPYGTVPTYARLADREPHRVQVFSVLLDGVARSPELLEEINDLNLHLALLRVLWAEGQVVLASELPLEDLDAESLFRCVRRVGETAVSLGPTLASVFGGRHSPGTPSRASGRPARGEGSH